MIEVLLDVCGHYSSTYTFRNSEGRERERVAAQREFSERKFFQNNAVKSFFRDTEIYENLKPLPSIYRRPPRAMIDIWN